MKKIILTAFVLLSLFSNAQEKQEETTKNETPKLSYIIKVKMGFSELKIDDYNNFNGNTTALEIMLSSKLSNKFRLEYGLGLSEFKATNLYQNELVNIKNSYYHLPVNLLYNKEVSTNGSLIIGLGLYGSYLAKSDIGGGIFKGNNVGVNLGYNLQIGANLKLSEEMDFRIMFEGLNDITKIENDFFKLKHSNTSLLSLSFIYKL